MARPRAYDEREVIEAVLRVFWERGYAGTSIADLQQATGLAKASLYGAFGDKEGLFVAALAAYGRCFHDTLQRQDAGPVRSLLLAFVAVSRAYDGLGCFAVHSADERPVLPPRARASLDELLALTERLMAERVHAGREVQEIDPAQDPEEVSELLMVFLRGLSSTARRGADCDDLERRVAQMMGLLAPP